MKAALGLFDNLPLKAASLAIAVVLWYVIAGEKTSERGLVVPVELQNFPKDLEMTGESLNTVEVRLRASPGIIHSVGPADISAEVDLAGAGEGERIVHLGPDSIRTPFGVRVVKITPSLLTLRLERTLQKTVPVKPRLLGRPAPGYEVASVESVPPEVRIAGPKSRVHEVESAHTEPVPLDGAEADLTASVNVGLDDPVLRLLDSPRVRVTARVAEASATRVLEGLKVLVRGGTAQVRPAAVKVTLRGPASLVEKLDPADVHPYVTPGPGAGPRAKVALDAGPGLTVVKIEPEDVTLRVPGKRN